MKPRVLLIADVPVWSFDRNLRDMAAHLGDRFAFDFWYCLRDAAPDLAVYGAIYAAYRWLPAGFPTDRAIGSLRSQFFDPARPGPPTMADAREVNRWAAFHVITHAPYEALRIRCPRLRYLTSPVDLRRFRPCSARGSVIASWSGDARMKTATGAHLKGFAEIVAPACRADRVPLVYAEARTCRVPPDEMPAFYARGNVTLCASLHEGVSNSVMEAMACGHALISTDCGNVREMQESQQRHLGTTGIVIVDRSSRAFAEALAALTPARVAEMGAINAEEIRARWSWDVWSERYAALIGSVLASDRRIG